MTLDLDELEKLMVLMEKHLIDTVQIDGIKIEKKIHTPKPQRKAPVKQKAVNLTEEDMLFYSSQAGPIPKTPLKKFLPKTGWKNPKDA